MPRKKTQKKSATAQRTAGEKGLATGNAGNDLVLTDGAAYQTYKWILEGQHEKDIIEALAEKFPESDPTKILVAVMDHVASLAQADPDVIRGWSLAALREIYYRAMTIGAFSDAIRCVRELNHLAQRNRSQESTGELS